MKPFLLASAFCALLSPVFASRALAAPPVETESGLRGCDSGCAFFIGLQGIYPVSRGSSGALSGIAAGSLLMRSRSDDHGPVLQRLPYASYSVLHPLLGLPRDPGVDVTTLATLPAALFLERFRFGNGSTPWLAAPAELLALPNSTFSFHFGDHPLGLMAGFATRLLLRDGLQAASYLTLGVEVDGGYYRFQAGTGIRLYGDSRLGMESVPVLFRIDLLPETWAAWIPLTDEDE